MVLDAYDHTNVSERPIILINNYHNHRHPYLTMIILWDEKVNCLLSSRYDPLKVGLGEAGIPREEDDKEDSVSGLYSSYSSAWRSKSPRNKKRIKIQEMEG